MNKNIASIPADYASWLAEIKERVTAARQRAVLAANAELVQLYWQIGHELLQQQQSAQWGDKVLDRLSRDLRDAFPEIKGFSSRNLKYMRYFAEHCPQQAFGQQPAAQLPWFHIVTLLTKLPTVESRIGVAEYELVRALPETFATSLPTVEELENELGNIKDEQFEAATGKDGLYVRQEKKEDNK